MFFGIGFGTVTPDSPAGQIVTQSNHLNETSRFVSPGHRPRCPFSGLTGGYLGLYAFNVVVPNVAASDTVPLSFSLNGTPLPRNLVIPISN